MAKGSHRLYRCSRLRRGERDRTWWTIAGGNWESSPCCDTRDSAARRGRGHERLRGILGRRRASQRASVAFLLAAMSTFTVKATYRNETRKFTFPEPCRFPSYKELCEQVSLVRRLSSLALIPLTLAVEQSLSSLPFLLPPEAIVFS